MISNTLISLNPVPFYGVRSVGERRGSGSEVADRKYQSAHSNYLTFSWQRETWGDADWSCDDK